MGNWVKRSRRGGGEWVSVNLPRNDEDLQGTEYRVGGHNSTEGNSVPRIKRDYASYSYDPRKFHKLFLFNLI